ncbi:MAG: hypothetical protein IVW53_00300 [Chloroflexi bacterium]|nr:hypothetical protein [Chloroflexota bacterium]
MTTSMDSTPAGRSKRRFVVLVYRMPPKPTASRVAVWRQLKKIGGVYLQQSAIAFAQNPRVVRDLRPLLGRIQEAGGEYHLLPVGRLSGDEEAKLVELFVQQSSRHYAEIIEECEVDFAREIEFETFRRNFTYEEAEEIRAEYEKLLNWFEWVHARDWFGAPNRETAVTWLDRCRLQLEAFEAKVYGLHSKGRGRTEEMPIGGPGPGLRELDILPAPSRERGRRRAARASTP